MANSPCHDHDFGWCSNHCPVAASISAAVTGQPSVSCSPKTPSGLTAPQSVQWACDPITVFFSVLTGSIMLAWQVTDAPCRYDPSMQPSREPSTPGGGSLRAGPVGAEPEIRDIAVEREHLDEPLHPIAARVRIAGDEDVVGARLECGPRHQKSADTSCVAPQLQPPLRASVARRRMPIYLDNQVYSGCAVPGAVATGPGSANAQCSTCSAITAGLPELTGRVRSGHSRPFISSLPHRRVGCICQWTSSCSCNHNCGSCARELRGPGYSRSVAAGSVRVARPVSGEHECRSCSFPS